MKRGPETRLLSGVLLALLASLQAGGHAWAAEPVSGKEGIRLSLTDRLGELDRTFQGPPSQAADTDTPREEGLIIRLATRLSGQFAGTLAAPEWALREELKTTAPVVKEKK